MAKRTVLIIGGNSFLGFHLTRALTDGFDLTPTYLTLKPTDDRFVRCNLLSKPNLFGLGQFDCIIHYSSIIAGNGKIEKNRTMTLNAIDYSNKIRAKYIYISSSQVKFSIDSEYKRSKVISEDLISGNADNYVIIRPAAPYGPTIPYAFTRRQPFHVLASVIANLPVVPVIGNGRYLRQPVHVNDLNSLVRCCIESDLTNAVFEIGGPRQITFNEIIDIIANSKARRILKLHLPRPFCNAGALLTGFMDSDLVNAVSSDEAVDNSQWQRMFPIDLIPFEKGVSDL